MQLNKDIAVVIVEDRDTIRKALELIVDGTPGMICAATFSDAESLLSTEEYACIDVVLLDIGLPGKSGVEAIRPIRAHWPTAKICMLTVHDDEDLIFDALCCGATGYLLKNTPPAQILDDIREIQAGGAPMSASVARKVVHFFRKPLVDVEALTARENEVLQLIVDGKTNRQIAQSLFISENTVAFHIKQIYEKLHVHTRAQVVARAMKRHR